jgi:hypothetical protein
MAEHRKTRQEQVQTSTPALTYDMVRFLKGPHDESHSTESPVPKTLLRRRECRSTSSEPAVPTNHAAVALFGNLAPTKKLFTMCS